MVRRDKLAGHFGDELVEALCDMVGDRWQPSPAPTWVTCVPSLKHPELVPDLARRVAARLQLPFVDAVRKVRHNEAQKAQENAFHQCLNLDGAFDLSGPVRREPVLLLDDVVDSKWTLTVVAALLRQDGVPVVWPVRRLVAATSGD